MRNFLKVILMTVLFMAMPIGANADKWDAFYVTDANSQTLSDEQVVDCVYPNEKNEKYYLFLPGAWDAQNLIYTQAGKTAYFVEGNPLVSGQVTNIFVPGTTVTLCNEKGQKKATVKVMQGSRIQTLFLMSETGSMEKINERKKNEEAGTAVILSKEGKRVTAHLTQIKSRGNASAAFRKDSYQIKFENKVDLTGSGKAKTWILLANYMDMSLLRNAITLDMAAFVGLPYALDCESVDVYTCGEYRGVFLLTEKIQIGESRIDIRNLEEANDFVNGDTLDTYAKFEITDDPYLKIIKGYDLDNDPEDITGGYILEYEKPHRFNRDEDNGIRTQNGMNIVVKEPTQASEKQLRYIGEIFDAFHRAILRKDGYDPVTGAYYLDRFDLDSLVKKYMLEEISKNYDAHGSSQFFFKDSDLVDPKIYAGPAWDYDLSYGNFDDGSFGIGHSPKTLFLSRKSGNTLLYNRLHTFPDFKKRLQEIYASDYRAALETLVGIGTGREGMQLKSIDAYATEIAASAQMNGVLWNSSYSSGYIKEAGDNFEKAVTYLKKFLEKRLAFLNVEWAMPLGD